MKLRFVPRRSTSPAAADVRSPLGTEFDRAAGADVGTRWYAPDEVRAVRAGWQRSTVTAAAWDPERGSLVVTAGGLTGALATRNDHTARQIVTMLELETTTVTAYVDRDGMVEVRFLSPSWSYWVLPLGIRTQR